MIKQIRQRLTHFQPRLLQTRRPQAAVLVAITNEPDPKVVLTQRAAKLSSHSGEVAFAGGKQDATDPDLGFTALREAHEEIGLEPSEVEIIGQMGQVMSKHQLVVTPFVGLIDPDAPLTPNPGELDAVFNVPLKFFLTDHRHHTDEIVFKGKSRYVPAYQYDGYLIWGLTAYILVELLNECLDANIPMKPRPETDVIRHKVSSPSVR
jgi:8-oxo-dGTP pyrophosphatase MutT (NUDIX family)